ncbi:hypothetical protein Goarm_005223 [Gossypium armourianum]|uniref:Uncharacterized protein n=1 Tax=Gossypium armourianum TaxID=34283 RepID=A0A7J9JZH9_9ROSI|nr:hypothetical protein [Gossypium armourianum]
MIRSGIYLLDLHRLFDAGQVTKPRTFEVATETH